jgi:hypothetical protein
MRNEHFDVTVTVGNAREDKARVVTDTVQAAESLLEDWPQDRRGPKYRAALRACMDVMEQRKGVASARKAFIAAAREAHLLVRKSGSDSKN